MTTKPQGPSLPIWHSTGNQLQISNKLTWKRCPYLFPLSSKHTVIIALSSLAPSSSFGNGSKLFSDPCLAPGKSLLERYLTSTQHYSAYQFNRHKTSWVVHSIQEIPSIHTLAEDNCFWQEYICVCQCYMWCFSLIEKLSKCKDHQGITYQSIQTI